MVVTRQFVSRGHIPRMRHVRLTRILAPILNGVDLSAYRPGDIAAFPDSIAIMLIREGWAESVPDVPSDPGSLSANRSE
jgi:hypothetical protein